MAKGLIGNETVFEQGANLPIDHRSEVLVAGGGLAGFAAAMGAARAGADTLLLELNNAPGGMATFQGLSGMTKLFYGPDNTRVMRGVLAELVEKYSEAAGKQWDWDAYAGYIAPGWTWWCYDLELMKLVMTEMLVQAGVRLLFNTWVSRGIEEGGKALGVIYESKKGRRAALAKCIVDATGDMDVAASIGVPVRVERENNRDTFVFRVGNVDFERTFQYLMANPEEIGSGDAELVEKRRKRLEVEWKQFGFFALPDVSGSTFKGLVSKAVADGRFSTTYGDITAVDRFGIEGLGSSGITTINTGIFTGLDNLDADSLTKAQLAGRKMAYYVVDNFLRPYVPGFEKCVVVSTASQLGVRTSRKFEAEYNPVNGQDIEGTHFPDVTGIMCPTQTFLTEIPYRAFVPQKIDNLLIVSGRSFPNDKWPAYPFRETPGCLVMGHGAGVAAAVSARQNTIPRQLAYADIQRELLRQDAYLGTKARLSELGLV